MAVHMFCKYLDQLTFGEYNDEPLRLLSCTNDNANFISDGHLKTEEMCNTLLLGIDTIIVADSIAT